MFSRSTDARESYCSTIGNDLTLLFPIGLNTPVHSFMYMSISHKGSFKISKEAQDAMYKNPPTYPQFIAEVASKNITKMERALVALGLLTSGRVTELISCKANDIILYDYNNKEITTGIGDYKTPAGSFYKGLQPKDVKYAMITLKNEKNPRSKFKTIPVINVGDFEIPFKWLIERLQELPDPIYETYIYGKGRTPAWFLLKEINPAYKTHYLRHFGTSHDVRNNLNPIIIQKKNGWVDMKQMDRYTHLSSDSMLKGMAEVYKKEEVKPIIKEVQPKPAYIAPSMRPFVSHAEERKKYDRAGHRIIQKTQKELDNELLQVV